MSHFYHYDLKILNKLCYNISINNRNKNKIDNLKIEAYDENNLVKWKLELEENDIAYINKIYNNKFINDLNVMMIYNLFNNYKSYNKLINIEGNKYCINFPQNFDLNNDLIISIKFCDFGEMFPLILKKFK